MARCRAETPCEFWNDVHEAGCPQRGAGISDPRLRELYVTETPEERATLTAVLEHLLAVAGRPDVDTDEVHGREEEWVAIRRAIRTSAGTAEVPKLARSFHIVQPGELTELQIV